MNENKLIKSMVWFSLVFIFLFSQVKAITTCSETSTFSSWTYCRDITITDDESVSDLQMKLVIDTATLISEGKMNSDCSDLRFADESDNELSYWIEDGTCNSAYTVVWIKVSTTNGDKKIFMYYGNSGATSVSNGDDVFPFFDDFEGTSIDSSKWSVVSGTWSIEDGTLKYTDSGGDSFIVGQFSTTWNTKTYVAETRYKVEDKIYSWGGIGIDSTDDASSFYRTALGYSGSLSCDIHRVQKKWTPYNDECVSGWETNHWFVLRIYQDSSNVYGEFREGEYGSTYYDLNNDNQLADTSLSSGKIVLTGYKADVWYDWVFVRKYVETEPTYSVGEEQYTSTENLPPTIEISSPENTTYYTDNIDFIFKVTDDNSTTFHVKAWFGSTLLYDNSTYQNNTEIIINLQNYINEDNTFYVKVWANDMDSETPQTSEKTIYFTTELYYLSSDLLNVSEYSGIEYGEVVRIKTIGRCGDEFGSAQTNITISYNGSTLFYHTLTCDNLTNTFYDTWHATTEGNITLNITLFKVDGNVGENQLQNFTADLTPPEVNITSTFHVGFFLTQPEETGSYSASDTISPYLNCSYNFGNSTGEEQLTPSDYGTERNHTFHMQHLNTSLEVSCVDIIGHNTTQTLIKHAYVFKIKPIDEETGVYDEDLWVDSVTGNASLFRFSAFDKNMNESYIFENISETVYLQLPITKEWWLRFEQTYSDIVVSGLYDLEYTPETVYVCTAQDKPYIYQTAYSSVQLEGAFGITRSDTGCVRTIQPTGIVENGYGFYFYTMQGQYALWYIPEEKTWEDKLLLASFPGDAQTVVDLERALLLIQEISEIPIPNYGFLLISKVSGQNATLIRYLSTETLSKFQINLTRLGESNPFYTQTLYDVQSVRLQINWDTFGLNSSDIIYVDYYVEYDDGRYDEGRIRTTPTGREIWFLWWQTVALMSIPLVLTFVRILNIKEVLIYGILYIIFALILIPHSEINIWVQGFGLMAIVAGAAVVVIISKLV